MPGRGPAAEVADTAVGKAVREETNMVLDNTSHPSVKHCADKVNARYIHGRPGPSWFRRATRCGSARLT